MGEPVVESVIGNLFLGRAVGGHAPDLHGAGAIGIEVDPAAIGGVVRTIVEPCGGGETGLRAATRGDGIDIKLALALGAIGEGPAIGGPTMPVRWRGLSD